MCHMYHLIYEAPDDRVVIREVGEADYFFTLGVIMGQIAGEYVLAFLAPAHRETIGRWHIGVDSLLCGRYWLQVVAAEKK